MAYDKMINTIKRCGYCYLLYEDKILSLCDKHRLFCAKDKKTKTSVNISSEAIM